MRKRRVYIQITRSPDFGSQEVLAVFLKIKVGKLLASYLSRIEWAVVPIIIHIIIVVTITEMGCV